MCDYMKPVQLMYRLLRLHRFWARSARRHLSSGQEVTRGRCHPCRFCPVRCHEGHARVSAAQAANSWSWALPPRRSATWRMEHGTCVSRIHFCVHAWHQPDGEDATLHVAAPCPLLLVQRSRAFASPGVRFSGANNCLFRTVRSPIHQLTCRRHRHAPSAPR